MTVWTLSYASEPVCYPSTVFSRNISKNMRIAGTTSENVESGKTSTRSLKIENSRYQSDRILIFQIFCRPPPDLTVQALINCMLCAIWYHLYNLTKRQKHPNISACNITKSNLRIAPHLSRKIGIWRAQFSHFSCYSSHLKAGEINWKTWESWQLFVNIPAWKLFVFGVFLVRIFPHSDWIRRYTEYLSVFSLNAGKYGPDKVRIRTFFTQCTVLCTVW